MMIFRWEGKAFDLSSVICRNLPAVSDISHGRKRHWTIFIFSGLTLDGPIKIEAAKGSQHSSLAAMY